ncbi:MAG TPA: hypothetical protein VGF45_01090 [Polyangia bacterium]
MSSSSRASGRFSQRRLPGALPALLVGAFAAMSFATGCAPRTSADRTPAPTTTIPDGESPAQPAGTANPTSPGSSEAPSVGDASPVATVSSDAGVAPIGDAGAPEVTIPTPPQITGGQDAADLSTAPPIATPTTIDAQAPDATTSAPDVSPPPLPPAAIDAAPKPQMLVAFLVAAPNTPAAAETQMRERLESRGFTVRFVADNAVASEADDAALVLISSTVHSPSLAIGFHTLAKPIMVMKASLFDELGMTGAVRGADSGEDTGSEVRIVNEAHPLAAGLRGMVRVAPTPAAVAWGRPGEGAVKIAVMGLEPTKVALFAYERGATMLDRVAPARRVGFFATDRSGITGSTEAMRLFDAAVDWALR